MDILEIDFNALRDEVHEMAKSKGWWESDHDNAEVYALVVSELYEALEAKRSGTTANLIAYKCLKDSVDFDAEAFLFYIKDSVADELADCFIRLLDKAGRDGTEIDLEHWSDLCKFVPFESFSRSLIEITESICRLSYYSQSEHIKAQTNFTLLQIASLCANEGIDLHEHIILKMRYNSTRPHKHGKQF